MNLNIERKAHRELEKLAREQNNRECQEFYRMSDGMKRLLCDYCDKKGYVVNGIIKGRCIRYNK